MNVRVAQEGRVRRVTLARAAKRNALDVATCGELVAAFRDAEADPSTGAVLLDAEGEVFCAGMDLEEVRDPGIDTSIHEDLFTVGSRIAKPIVAAAQGVVLAGGVGLVANAHVVVAAQGTSFGLSEIRIGMWPFVIFRAVARAIGERRAIELSLTGRIFSTNEAQAWGLVHETAPPFEFDDRADAIAATLAGASAEATQTGLRFVNRARSLPWDAAGRLALDMRAQLMRGADFAEGLQAFHEKRKPKWPSAG